MSSIIADQINVDNYPSNFSFYKFDHKPFFNLKGLKTWRRLIELEKLIVPNCVFSIFGPSVWKPNSPHLMGYAYAYYVYPESPFFKIISWKLRVRIWLYQIFHKFYFEKNGKYYVCETKDVSNRLSNYISCAPKNVYTVTNCSNQFFDIIPQRKGAILPKRKANEYRFVTLSSFATHKNLTILNQVIPILKSKCKYTEFKFILTVDEKLFEERFSNEVKANLINLDRIDAKECPQVYNECDAMFLPTLMECFSASYVESMKMELPIATSNLPFAKTVCGYAALYFDPMNPDDIAEKLCNLIQNRNLQQKLINKGMKRLQSFDTPSSRAKKYLELCKMISIKRGKDTNLIGLKSMG